MLTLLWHLPVYHHIPMISSSTSSKFHKNRQCLSIPIGQSILTASCKVHTSATAIPSWNSRKGISGLLDLTASTALFAWRWRKINNIDRLRLTDRLQISYSNYHNLIIDTTDDIGPLVHGLWNLNNLSSISNFFLSVCACRSLQQIPLTFTFSRLQRFCTFCGFPRVWDNHRRAISFILGWSESVWPSNVFFFLIFLFSTQWSILYNKNNPHC